MTKIFIDTNIFLGFYETNNNPITIFDKDISKLKSNLILTDQVYDEFIRNRDKQLVNLIHTSKKNKCTINTSSIIRSLAEFKDLDKMKDDFVYTNKLLTMKLQEMKDDTNKDPIYKSFLELYNDHNVTKYKRSNEIIKSAHERKLLGNPPVGYTQYTIGDEVNWETLLSNLKDDLYIISFDKTYEQHATFLKNEFKSKTGKELIIHDSISSVLKIIGQEPSEELNKFEEDMISTPVIGERLRQSILLNQTAIGSIARALDLGRSSAIGIAAQKIISDQTAIGNIARALDLGGSMQYNPAFRLLAPEMVSYTKSADSLHELEVCPECGNNEIGEGNQCSSCGHKYDYAN